MSVSFSTVIQKLRPSACAKTEGLKEYVAQLQPTIVSELKNGMRVATEAGRGDFATIGVWLKSGSRYEDRSQSGVAKMLQNLSLESTTTHDRVKLAKAVEDIGGHLHAYTGRDRTAYYVKCLKKDVPNAVALLAQFVRNPLVTDETVEAQKKVMLTNLKEAEEDTDTQIHDLLHTAAYDSTEQSLGANPLGSERTIANLDKNTVTQFYRNNWTADRMVLVGCGGVTQDVLEPLAQKHFGDVPTGHDADRKKIPSRYVGGDVKLWNLRQKVTHVCWAFETCGAQSADTIPMRLLNNLYGRFHRSQHDLVNHSSQLIYKSLTSMDFCTPTVTHFPEKGIESITPFFHSYDDTGLCGLHFVCRPENTGGIIDNIWQYVQYSMGDVCRLTQKAVHEHELVQAKLNYKASLLMTRDGATNNAEDIARELLLLGRRIPLEEMFARIDDVTPANMMEVLQHYYYSRRPVLAYSGYCYMTPHYDSVQHYTYKFLY